MTTKYAWLVRLNPCDVKRIIEFQTQNIVALQGLLLG